MKTHFRLTPLVSRTAMTTPPSVFIAQDLSIAQTIEDIQHYNPRERFFEISISGARDGRRVQRARSLYCARVLARVRLAVGRAAWAE